MNEHMLTFYRQSECKAPRYPLYPEERPKFYCTVISFIGDEFVFDFEDTESAEACARYNAMGIEYELVFNDEEHK